MGWVHEEFVFFELAIYYLQSFSLKKRRKKVIKHPTLALPLRKLNSQPNPTCIRCLRRRKQSLLFPMFPFLPIGSTTHPTSLTSSKLVDRLWRNDMETSLRWTNTGSCFHFKLKVWGEGFKKKTKMDETEDNVWYYNRAYLGRRMQTSHDTRPKSLLLSFMILHSLQTPNT